MRKLVFGFMAILLVSTAGTSYVSAKSSSGGGVPVEVAPVEAAPTPVVETAPAFAPTPTPVTPNPVKAEVPPMVIPQNPDVTQREIATFSPPEGVVCSKLEDLKARIKCRVEKTEEEFAIELTPENYFPEGCRWGSEEWQEKCKVRYRTIHDLYSLPLGEDRMKAIKEALGLPSTLQKKSVECEGKESSCAQEYEDKIVNLIVARFYDIEQRAEELNVEGKITDEQLIDFVVKVSEAKVSFYASKEKPNPNIIRSEIINNLQVDWNLLVKDL